MLNMKNLPLYIVAIIVIGSVTVSKCSGGSTSTSNSVDTTKSSETAEICIDNLITTDLQTAIDSACHDHKLEHEISVDESLFGNKPNSQCEATKPELTHLKNLPKQRAITSSQIELAASGKNSARISREKSRGRIKVIPPLDIPPRTDSQILSVLTLSEDRSIQKRGNAFSRMRDLNFSLTTSPDADRCDTSEASSYKTQSREPSHFLLLGKDGYELAGSYQDETDFLVKTPKSERKRATSELVNPAQFGISSRSRPLSIIIERTELERIMHAPEGAYTCRSQPKYRHKRMASDYGFYSGGLKNVREYSSLVDEDIPDSLVPLDETFKSISQKIRESEDPDIIDVICLFDANGKTQSIVLMNFLAELEKRIAAAANKKFQGSDLKLFSVVDVFVGAGSGSIPAAVAAMGQKTIAEAIPIVNHAHSKMLTPKKLCKPISYFGTLSGFGKSIVSAYFSKPTAIEDSSSDMMASLTYDTFDFSKSAGIEMTSLFGACAIEDLKSSLEVISLSDSENIAELVSGALSARDKDAKARVKRLSIAETLEIAENAISATSDASGAHNVDVAVDTISQVNMIFKKSAAKKYCSLGALRNNLIAKTGIQRDLIILNVSADTVNGSFFIPSFDYKIKLAKNGLRIVNMNYRFAVPNYLYKSTKKQSKIFANTINSGIDMLFPSKLEKKNMKAAVATQMLVDFLDSCNKRVLEEMLEQRVRETASSESPSGESFDPSSM